MIANIKAMCVMVQLRGLLGTSFSLEEHLDILGTNVGNFVPIGTFFCAGDIRGQKLVPKGTILRRAFDYNRY